MMIDRSAETVHLFFRRALLETCTSAPAESRSSTGCSGVPQVHCIVRQLFLGSSAASRGIVRRSRSGRVKQLESTWALAARTGYAKELHVGPVDARAESAPTWVPSSTRDCDSKNYRIVLPLRSSVGLMTSLERREHSTVRGNGDAREEVPAFDFMLKLFAGLLVLLVTVFFFFFVFFCLHTRGCVKGFGTACPTTKSVQAPQVLGEEILVENDRLFVLETTGTEVLCAEWHAFQVHGH